MSDVRTRSTALSRQQAVPRVLGEYANGHAHHSDEETSDEDVADEGQVEASLAVTSESSSEETGERAHVTFSERAILRHSPPAVLVAIREWQADVHLLYWLIGLRFVNALITSRTQFAPDEHWQSQEIAHRIVFGYGWKTWEWQDQRPNVDHFFNARYWGDGPIRSVIYPALFVPVYWLLHITNWHNVSFLLTTAPSLVQACIAALTDWFTFRLARRILNERSAWASLLSSLCSMYTFHSSARTLSNSAEAALTIAALHFWPLSIPEDSDSDFIGDLPLIESSSLFKAVVLFAISAALRPSNVLLSAALVLLLVRRIVRHVKSAATALEATFALIILLRTILFVALATSAALLGIDSLYYGRMTFTPLAFLKRNVLQGISVFYGASPFHFYVTSALPFIGFTTLPFALRGLWFAFKRPHVSSFDKPTRRWLGFRGENDPAAIKMLADACIMFVCAMSFLSHKEVRFLQPIVPVLHIMQGYAMVMLIPIVDSRPVRWARRDDSASRSQAQLALARRAHQDRTAHSELLRSLRTFTSWQGRHHLLPPKPSWRSTVVPSKLRDVTRFIGAWNGKVALIALSMHVLPIIYLSLHSSGQLRVAQHVGHLSRTDRLHSVGFLMPCHSTPWMSHMHAEALSRNDRAWFISCEPPLKAAEMKQGSAYQDESDVFYRDPSVFIEKTLSTDPRRPWPSHLVMFEALLEDRKVTELLENRGYALLKTFWNSLFHLDPRRRGRIVIMNRMTTNVQQDNHGYAN